MSLFYLQLVFRNVNLMELLRKIKPETLNNYLQVHKNEAAF